MKSARCTYQREEINDQILVSRKTKMAEAGVVQGDAHALNRKAIDVGGLCRGPVMGD